MCGKAHAAICEYTGRVLVDPAPGSLDGDDYVYSLPVVDPTVVISAKSVGSVARLLNHGEAPSAKLKTVHHDGELRVVCVALRPICAGEQILINYGDEYWKKAGRHRLDLLS